MQDMDKRVSSFFSAYGYLNGANVPFYQNSIASYLKHFLFPATILLFGGELF
jgi:hypothetical protein